MRINASEIFRSNGGGSYTIIRPVKIGGATLNNVTFTGGVRIAGINLNELVDKFLEVEESKGVVVIKGYYNN